MKAVIMAGGQGTRARPFTEYFPKAMIPVNNRPMIEYITDYLESYDIISEIIIVADLANKGAQIKNHYSRHAGKPVSFVQDRCEGTGGDLRHLDVRGDFLLWFSDNLCALDVSSMIKLYKSQSASACIATRSKRYEETGFADVHKHIIRQFWEKPVLRLPHHECLGMYIFGDKVIDTIRKKPGRLNLSYDILEKLAQEDTVISYDIGDTPWADIESPNMLERHHDTIKSITEQMESRNPSLIE